MKKHYGTVTISTSRGGDRILQGMALARLRGTIVQQEIESASGPAISTAIAAGRLQRSVATVRKLVKKGGLVGYRPAAAANKILLPLWQFSSRTTTHKWVPKMIKIYGSNGIALINFVTVPRTHLEGGNYLRLLLNGRSDEVIRAARRSNPC